jgi:hypothetical protein
MNWYYVEAGKQAGPVDDAGLEALAAAGRVTNETLVWREGMANWQAYGEVRPGGLKISSGAAVDGIGEEEAVCAECGQMFPISETIKIGDARVCANCKPIFVQKMREGVTGRIASGGNVTEEQILEREYRIEIGSAVERGWKTFTGNAGVMIATMILVGIVFIIGWALSLVLAMIVPFSNIFVPVLYSMPLMAGYLWLSLRLVRGEAAGIGDGFAGFGGKYLQLVGFGIVQFLINTVCFLPLIVVGIAAGVTVGLRHRVQAPEMATGMVLGLVAAGFVTFCGLMFLNTLWTFTGLLIMDKGYRFWPAMQLSRRLVMRRWWMTLLFIIVCFIFYMLGALLCVVGLLATLPLYSNMKAILYDDNFRDLAPQG